MIQRYIKSITFWGSIASILGLAFFFLPKKNNLNLETKGDYSPGIVVGDYNINKGIEIPKFSYEISPLQKGNRANYVRVVKIRNNSKSTIHAFHFSIRCDKPIVRASEMPFVEGGIFTINYDKVVNNTYEVEIEPLRPNKAVIVALGANEPFEVINIRIYNE
jgi:hypothetical protein